MSLLTLDEYCLANVFKYFSLDELMLIFGKVHTRIDNAIEWQLHRFRHVEFTMRFPPQYDANQLQTLGQHVEFLSVNVGYSIRAHSVLDLLKPLCMGASKSARLKALRIEHAYITNEYLNILCPVAPLLLELDLSRSDVVDHSQLTVFLHSAIKLKMLALSSKDVNALDSSLFGRIQVLKINWLMGTVVSDVTELSQQYPLLTIFVYRSGEVDEYGPPPMGKTAYFH